MPHPEALISVHVVPAFSLALKYSGQQAGIYYTCIRGILDAFCSRVTKKSHPELKGDVMESSQEPLPTA